MASCADASFTAAPAEANRKDEPSSKVAAMKTLQVETPLGHLRWGKGPVPNVVPTPIPPGSYPLVATLSGDADYGNATARGSLVVTNSAGSAAGTGLVLAGGATASFAIF